MNLIVFERGFYLGSTFYHFWCVICSRIVKKTSIIHKSYWVIALINADPSVGQYDYCGQSDTCFSLIRRVYYNIVSVTQLSPCCLYSVRTTIWETESVKVIGGSVLQECLTSSANKMKTLSQKCSDSIHFEDTLLMYFWSVRSRHQNWNITTYVAKRPRSHLPINFQLL